MRISLWVAVFLPVLSLASDSPPDQVLLKLNEALMGEYSAAHRYEAFAARADRDGYKPIGKLFRAAARAEVIHRNGLASAIKAMGGTPGAFLPERVTVAHTRENLKLVIAAETFEATNKYPELINTLKAEKGSADALKITQYALAAEKQHAALFQEALDKLERYQQAEFYVCPRCSAMALEDPGRQCRVCKARKPAIQVK